MIKMLCYKKIYLIQWLFHALPETGCFGIKNAMLRFCGAKVGKNVRICSSVKIFGEGFLEIGDNTWIGQNNILIVTSKISIGANVDIAPNCIMLNGSHRLTLRGERLAGDGFSEDITIGNGCWVCANSTILGSSNIGNHSLIAACSCTKGTYSENSFIRGVIADAIPLIRYYKDKQ